MSRYILKCQCGHDQFEYDTLYDVYTCKSCGRRIYAAFVTLHLEPDSSVDYSPTCMFTDRMKAGD